MLLELSKKELAPPRNLNLGPMATARPAVAPRIPIVIFLTLIVFFSSPLHGSTFIKIGLKTKVRSWTT